MRVRVKVFATLRRYVPPEGAEAGVEVELPEGATASAAIAALGIPAENAALVVSDEGPLSPGSPLRDGQEISLFPPLAGGL